MREEQEGDDADGSIRVVDADGLPLRLGAAPSLPEQYSRAMEGIAIGPEASGAVACAARGQAVATPDIATDPQWAPLQSMASELGLVANWTIPILASTGQVLGTLGTYIHDSRAPSAH